MPLRFVTCDVFTELRHGGNPLAVVFDGEQLDAAAMQRIAAEFNLSETVFVLPPTRPDAAFRLRIFTPAAELPFAGHPTVGAALTLAWRGAVQAHAGRADVVFEEGAGPVPVSVRFDGARPVYAELTAPRAVAVRPVDPDPTRLAAALGFEGLLPGLRGWAPVVADCGVPFLMVPLASPAALAVLAPDAAALARLAAEVDARGLYVFAPVEATSAGYRARMFAAGLGIAEDPATGAAASAFAGWVAGREGPASGVWRGVIEQGVEMGRPSRIVLAVDREQGRNGAIRVGGGAVAVSEGQLLD